MDTYVVSFSGMAGGGVDLLVDKDELDYLITHGLVEVRATKIRRALLPELAGLYSGTVEEEEKRG